MKQNELVSVHVITYQHAPWIGKTLESILAQKTTFSYRIYVHDDASTDGTREIVESYAARYPDKIVALLEEENQYSKGRRITPEIMLPHMKGKYVASCEGDDYWVSPHKLQKQIQYMENHSDCTLSFSNAIIIDTHDTVLRKFFPQNIWNDKNIRKKLLSENSADFSMEEMILLDFIPTASTVYYRKTLEVIQDQFQSSLDLLTRLVAASHGYAHYHNEIFSAYRIRNPNSTSYYVNQSADNMKRHFLDLHKKLLNDVDQYTEYSYHEVIEKEIERNLMEFYIRFGDYQSARELSCYRELAIKPKIKLLLKNLPAPVYLLTKIIYKAFQTIKERIFIILYKSSKTQ